MSNVKPGDRAIVIKSICGFNFGKVVLVIEEYDGRPLPPRNVPYKTEGPELCWIVESLGGPFTITRCDSNRISGTTMVAVFADTNLRRLDPPEDTPVQDSLPVVEEIGS